MGLVYQTTAPFFGKIPDGTVGPLIGTPDQWINGLDYNTYIDGGYVNPNCIRVPAKVVPVRLRQAQRLLDRVPRTIADLPQAENLPIRLAMHAPSQPLQEVEDLGVLAMILRGADRIREAENIAVLQSAAVPLAEAQRLAIHAILVVRSGGRMAEAEKLAVHCSLSVKTGTHLRQEENLEAHGTLRAPTAPDVAEAENLAVGTSITGGGVPGSTCASAGTMVLGTSYTFNVTSPNSAWLKFAATGGTQYRVRLTLNSGAIGACNVQTGTCSSLSLQFALFGTGCGTTTPGSSTTVFVEITPNIIMGPGNVTVNANAGNCP